MNVKKSLENRIRGWFPKEPNLSEPFQQYGQPTAKTVKSQFRSGSRTSLFTALFAAFWTFFSFTFMFQLNTYFPSALSFRIIFLIVGISFGIFFSTLLTCRQLNTLEKKGEVPTTLKTIFITVGAAVIAVAVIVEIGFSNLPSVVESALGYSIFACAPAVLLTRTILMVYWEKQKRTRIFQDKYGFYISTNDANPILDQNISSQTFQGDNKVG